jgi:hypothetical protein
VPSFDEIDVSRAEASAPCAAALGQAAQRQPASVLPGDQAASKESGASAGLDGRALSSALGPWPNGGPSGLFARAKQPSRWSAYGAAMTEMSYVIPVVNEIVDPRSGRPISAMGDESQSQRALVAASLLRLPDR